MCVLAPPLLASLPSADHPDMTLHITIDPVACDAYGYCAELLPEAVVLDEWGYPIVDGRPLPAELVATARRAVRDCPRRAIALTRKRTTT
jgi:ferredoxin